MKKETGKLVLFSETFGANVDTGIIVRSTIQHFEIYWFQSKRKEFISRKMFKLICDNGSMCYA